MGIAVDGKNYDLVMFDLDDTLAPSKSPMSEEMAALLRRLLGHTAACIISGGRYEQFEMQVLARLGRFDDIARFHLMPTCGTQYVRWNGDDWETVYAENLTDDQKYRALKVLEIGAKELGLWSEQTWGPILEDRGSQITFSALGQSAPVAEKSQWDPENTKKEKLRAYAAERLPDLEVRSGGSTSVDITVKGIDKAYGTRKLIDILGIGPEQILFFGDRLDPGGNDYPVKEMGIDSVHVADHDDTFRRLTAILDAQPAT
ncbi:HAD-IIB family hydrolase [Williamsia sterculiae]|uniref:phosphomannomutase n=1 Tax=Williamsia sterculiae TaxID=1344003 RepID=A0A1N7EM93_9NOCA|nr:HAD-IIB family hydrolase [Williamsia sterculiae]SIR89206.1 hypothetical protein SAMN05445060_1460 [Williamsia sterculiae]